MALSSEAAANRSNPRSATLPQPLTPRVKRPRGKTPFSAELLNRNSAARLFGDALAPLVVRAGHFLDGVVGHTPTMPHAPTVGKRGSSDAYGISRRPCSGLRGPAASAPALSLRAQAGST